MNLQATLIFLLILVVAFGLIYIVSSSTKEFKELEPENAWKSLVLKVIVFGFILTTLYMVSFVETNNPPNKVIENRSSLKIDPSAVKEKSAEELRKDAEAKKNSFLKSVEENNVDSANESSNEYIDKAIERSKK